MPHTILLADDSKTIQRAVEIVFAKEADFTLVTVGNGDEAIAKAREVRPAVVLADHAMPGKDGYEVAEALKSDPSTQGIPVLLLSGSAAPFDEARAGRVGAQHIAKPFDCMTLLDRVQRLCGLKAADAPPPSPFAHLRPAGSGPAPATPAPSTPAPSAPTPAAPAASPFAASGPAPAAPAGLPRPPGAAPAQPAPAASPFGAQPAAPAASPFGQPAPVAAAPAARPDPFGLGDAGAARPAPTPASSSSPGFAQAVVAQATSAVASAAAPQIAASGAGAPSSEAISAAAREIIEKVVWEVVPELAETLIREEIARLLAERRG